MIVGTGVDLTEIARVDALLAEYGERFERKAFTEREIAYCRRFVFRQGEHYAARFAAKEAFSKAVGTGLRMGFRWQEIEVVRAPGGPPRIELHGGMRERYGHLRFHLSLTHSETQAMAFVIAESAE
jgi:holo-[acyl-carrier protein] synthase